MSATHSIEQIEAKAMVLHREIMKQCSELKELLKSVDQKFINRKELAEILKYKSSHSFHKNTERRLQAKGYIPKYDKGYKMSDAKILKRAMIKGKRRVHISKLEKL